MLLYVKTEKQLQDYLRRAAKAAGILYSKLESRSTNGWPDCILIAGGRVVFVELKTPRGTGEPRHNAAARPRWRGAHH